MPTRIPISIWCKQKVLRWVEEDGDSVPTRAIKHFSAKGWKLDGGSVRRWWRDREQLLAADPASRRRAGGGRRPLSGAMEEALYDEVVAKRLKKEKVTRTWIGHMARVIFACQGTTSASPDGFMASPHWITGFMRRYGLSLRRRTNLTTLSDDKLVDRAVSYMTFLQSAKPTMDLHRTILMDETAVYFEDAHNQTVDIIGSRHVVIRSTGFSSMWITAVLAVTATGKKLPPLLIWKGKALPSFDKIGGVYVAHQPHAWVDSKLLKRWIDLAFPLVDTGEEKHLVWDSMRAHISKEVKAKCAARNVSMCVIPGGLMPYLQAGNIGIYKTFKDLLYMEINAWKESDKVEYTRFSNPRMPSVGVVCGWVKKAWRDTDCETVTNSVTAAGFAGHCMDWHIARHDVYGNRFREKWEASVEAEQDEGGFNLDELHDALDDIALIDE
ncbi:hypothetical protein Pcac1_g852 [Phytophthora cactorum]|uniref:HTH CENPB-type domain-containing protein n=1 Tax=Phytophthora cactorum TaxID=29920 RepID=A0A8T1DBP7_9STRA|nr:hypothetical protein Pcac1_g852 [Phytophthora cactorum]KAG2937430.1 hypothetical protein PC115_g4215 [Phytophthora cactorum]